MKRIAIVLLGTILIGFAACKKDDEHNYDNHSSPLHVMMMSMDSTMDKLIMTGDPDHDFAMMMKVHHQGAITMANYELSNGTDATIKAMAQKMKDAQAKEIASLDSFMMAHSPSGSNMAFETAADAAMDKMMADMNSLVLKGQTDHDFVHLMIIHHESAIGMANAEIQHGQVVFMKNMAQMMKGDQTMEIGELQSWLNAGND